MTAFSLDVFSRFVVCCFRLVVVETVGLMTLAELCRRRGPTRLGSGLERSESAEAFRSIGQMLVPPLPAGSTAARGASARTAGAPMSTKLRRRAAPYWPTDSRPGTQTANSARAHLTPTIEPALLSPLESGVSLARIGPSNACPRAAPETTPLWRLFLIKLSLSLSLSLLSGDVALTVIRQVTRVTGPRDRVEALSPGLPEIKEKFGMKSGPSRVNAPGLGDL